MSHEGKLRRGKKWHEHRDRDGNLPEGIKLDPAKMADVNTYLESIKAEEKPEETVSKKKGRK